MISCRRAISDTTAPGAYDSATIRPLSSSLHRRRRPTPLRISTRPRGAVASTIWSTIYANRSCQHRSHLPNYAALRKMGAKHRLRLLVLQRNLFALTPLIPLFQACAGFAIRSPACEGVKTQNRVHGPILICTRCDSNRTGFREFLHISQRSRRPGHDLMRACDLLFRQHVANHGAQRHRVHRLVQQMVTAGAGLPQQLWTGVATDEEGGNLGGKYPAQPLYNFNTGFSAGQMIVRDN